MSIKYITKYIALKVGQVLFQFGKGSGKFVGYSAFGALSYYTFDQNVGCVRKIYGPSMVPTLNNGLYTEFNDFKYGKKSLFGGLYLNDVVYFSRDTKEIERGDIVFFQRPRYSSHCVKRVVAIEGDTVTPIKPGGKEGEPVIIKEGELWVESDAGDGHANSSLFGPIPKEAIEGIGKFVIIFDAKLPRPLYREIPKHVEGRVKIGPEVIKNQLQEAS